MKGAVISSGAAKLELVQFSGPSGSNREFCIEETKYGEDYNADWNAGRGRCAQAPLQGGGATEGQGASTEVDGQHAGGLAGAFDGTTSGCGDRAGGEHGGLLCHERAGGGGLAGAQPLDPHGGDRQQPPAEERPAGCRAPGAQAGGAPSGPVARGVVSTAGNSHAAAAGAGALLAGLTAHAMQ